MKKIDKPNSTFNNNTFQNEFYYEVDKKLKSQCFKISVVLVANSTLTDFRKKG